MAVTSHHTHEFCIESASKSPVRRWRLVVGVLMLAGMPVGSALGVKPPDTAALPVDRAVSVATKPVKPRERTGAKPVSSTRPRSIRSPYVDVDKINKSLSKGRVVAVEPPLRPEDVQLPPDAIPGLEALPTGVPLVIIEIDDDDTIAREGVSRAAAALPEARVFRQSRDSGFFLPNKDDIGNFYANQVFFGNGFQSGDSITGYDLLVYNSSSFSGTATALVELWDGDPLNTGDNTCLVGAFPAPIAGTQATFSSIPQASDLCPAIDPTEAPTCVGLMRLKKTFVSPVTINCDHVWMVLTLTDGCRLGWRVSGTPLTSWNVAPQVGTSNWVQRATDCGQLNACPTATGYNVGTCCDHGSQGTCSSGPNIGDLCNLNPAPGDPDPCAGGTCSPSPGASCDHTDGLTTNDCAGDFGSDRTLTFCTSGTAGLLTEFILDPGSYASNVATIFTDNQGVFRIKPVSSSDGGAVITGNEITLAAGNQVTLEITVEGWDPALGGTPLLKAWQIGIDSSGYSTGDQGVLAPYQVACTTNPECVSAVGAGSTCDTGICTAGFIDTSRTDYVYSSEASIDLISRATLDYLYASTINAGGGGSSLVDPGVAKYVGTLILQVPSNAAGGFEVGLLGEGVTSFLVDDLTNHIPFLAFESARIVIQPGACCVAGVCSVEDEPDCIVQSGYFLGSGTTCTGQCTTGSCCIPGSPCDDAAGAGIDEATCAGLGGSYTGGALCNSEPLPCGVCNDFSTANCQIVDPTQQFIMNLSDLSGPGGTTTTADDFKAVGNTVNKVCVWGAYLDPEDTDTADGDAVADCTDEVADNFRVTVYTDGGGKPGAILGTSTATVAKQKEAGTGFEGNNGIPVFAYQLTLDAPIAGLTAGVCYWLEVVNNTAIPLDNTCGWHWARSDQFPNDYHFAGMSNGYTAGNERYGDMAFCADLGIEPGGCGPSSGACCTCPIEDALCSVGTFVDCEFFNQDTWTLGETCPAVTCTLADRPGDTCSSPIPVTEGIHIVDNHCATNDGPNPIDTEFQGNNNFDADIWLTYTAQSTGQLTISMCGTQSLLDSMLAVYHDDADPTNCLICPVDNNALWPDGLARDESCNGVIDGGAGILSGTTSPGGCYVIRLGGFDGPRDTGNALLEITFIPDEPIVDCNGNGIPDAVDIAGPTSDDCDGNKVPDECDPNVDCNANGIQDVCDIAGATSDDCDADGVPDECDPGADCNSNGIPDSCDIAACAGSSPSCDDCNLNGAPDECDVASSTGCPTGICVSGCSADVNEDCVPDECFDWQGDVSSDFSNGNNWEGGATPDSNDNITIADVAVARNAAAVPATVQFDISATVATLRVLDNATLNITSAGTTDLTIAEAGGILNEGTMNVSLDHLVDVSAGAYTVGVFGSYKKDAIGPVSAELKAGSVSILPGNCSDFSSGGAIRLDDEMALTVSGDLVMVGSSGAACPSSRSEDAPDAAQVLRIGRCSAFAATANLGITPPPDLKFCPGRFNLGAAAGSSDSANIDFDPVVTLSGNFVLTGAVQTVNELTTIGVQLAGDFDNRSTIPSLFGWELGKLLMNGTGPQTFEVAGIDVGVEAFDDNDFLTNRDTLFDTSAHTNYAIGTLSIAAGSNVTFVNVFGNTVGAGDCTEALYVHQIELGDNSTITLDNARVYFDGTLTSGVNVAIVRKGCGDLVDVLVNRCSPASPALPATLFNTASADQQNRFVAITVGDAGRTQKIRVTFTSLPPPYDVWNGSTLWVGEPFKVCENSGQGVAIVPPTCGAAPGQPQKWFWAARLNCSETLAASLDWTTLASYCTGSGEPCVGDGDCALGTCGVDGAIHLTHSAIVPSKLAPGGGALQIPANYTIEVLDESCSSTIESSFSEPLFVTQAAWGDVVLDITTCPAGPPNLNIDVLGDVVGAINKFSNLPCAPKKTRVDLEPGTPDFRVNFTDVLQGLGAFTGATFPFPSGAVCPPAG